MRNMAQSLSAVLGAAMILLAFSEYVFVNEGPVRALLEVETAQGLFFKVVELVAFYLPAGMLLAALERIMTTWTRVLLVGAFTGWAIEAAIVPIAYEAIPFSYLWTSVSWHAVVDVAFGYVFFRMAMRSGWALSLLTTIAFGIIWPFWGTWTWPELQPSLDEFALLSGTVACLLTLGCWFADRAEPGRGLHKGWLWAAIAINGALWVMNAVPFLVAAAGLLVLAAITGLALWRAPDGTAPLVRGRPPLLRYLLPGLACLLAIPVHGWLLGNGAPIPSDDVIWPVAFGGMVWFVVALGLGLIGQRRAD